MNRPRTAADDFFLRKHLTALTADDRGRVGDLAQLDLRGLNETAVRERFLAPLIRLLGYRASGDYQVLYEDKFRAADWYVMYGREKMKLDYRFSQDDIVEIEGTFYAPPVPRLPRR